jgi:hypothetical protein
LVKNQEVEEKGLASLQALDFVARPAGFEPTTPWFVGGFGINQCITNQPLAALVTSASRPVHGTLTAQPVSVGHERGTFTACHPDKEK